MWVPPGANSRTPPAGTARRPACRMRLTPFSTLVSWIIAIAKSLARTSVTTKARLQPLRKRP